MIDNIHRHHRRVVTGHRDGKSVVLSDQRRPAYKFKTGGRFEHTCVWATNGSEEADPNQVEERLPKWALPAPGGSIVHVVTFPPAAAGTAQLTNDASAVAQEYLTRLPGLAETFEHDGSQMHTTRTIDYGLMLDGELWLELDDGKTVHLNPGDIVVQQGTRHAWRNKGHHPATIVFVMLAPS
jgi:hypothetical protein